MDIQVSSNFERLLFEMNGRDGGLTAEQLGLFRSTGRLTIEPDQRAEFVDGTFRAARFDDAATLDEIARVYADTGIQIDPHTATGTAAARRFCDDRPIVTLATAHPAKFPDAVEHGHRRAPATARTPERPVRAARAHADTRERSRHGPGVRAVGRPRRRLTLTVRRGAPRNVTERTGVRKALRRRSRSGYSDDTWGFPGRTCFDPIPTSNEVRRVLRPGVRRDPSIRHRLTEHVCFHPDAWRPSTKSRRGSRPRSVPPHHGK